MIRRLSPLLLVLLAGCPKPSHPAPIDYEQSPRLPAPIAGTYGRMSATPSDPVVADIAKGKRWDAYLSGGASALALAAAKAPQAPTPWAVRESLWRAGYPYPVDQVVAFQGPIAVPPPDAVRTWVASVPATSDLVLVRARGTTTEAWVGLVATPRVELGTLPRQLDPGQTLTLPAIAGARYRIADADGRLLEGVLDGGFQVLAERQGEWVVQVLDAQGVAAWFPVYVGIAPPGDDLLPPRPATVHDANDVARVVVTDLASVREAYGAGSWTRDSILDAAASRLEERPDDTLGAVLSGLGLGHPMATWTCTAPSAEACVDAWVWDPTRRGTLLSARLTHLGLAATLEGAKVRIRVVLTGD